MTDLSAYSLVETDWLAARINEPDLRIVDARWRGDGSGPQLYRAGHIPGAIHLAWDTDLTRTENGVRWLVLPPDQFAAVAGNAGIGDETRVVAYSDTDDSGAARLWWTLRYYGHDQVAVLNSGLTKWQTEQRPLTTEVIQSAPAHFTPRPQPHWLATAADIEAMLNDPETRACLVDARPPEQYAGQAVWTPRGSLFLPPGQEWVEVAGRPIRAGRIPGATSHHAVLNLNPEGYWCYHSPEKLREQAMAAGLKPEQRVIAYCGSGISASLELFALYLAGYRNLALYDASWEEWGSDPARQLERDDL